MATFRYIPVGPNNDRDPQSLFSAILTLSVDDYAMPDVNLSWTNLDSSYGTDVIAYYVYRRLNYGQAWTALQTSGTGVTYDDSTVSAGTLYYYQVKAVCRLPGGGTQEVWSNVVSCTPYVAGLTSVYVYSGEGSYLAVHTIDSSTYELNQPAVGSYYDNNTGFSSTRLAQRIDFLTSGSFLCSSGTENYADWFTFGSDFSRKAEVVNNFRTWVPQMVVSGGTEYWIAINASGGQYKLTMDVDELGMTITETSNNGYAVGGTYNRAPHCVVTAADGETFIVDYLDFVRRMDAFPSFATAWTTVKQLDASYNYVDLQGSGCDLGDYIAFTHDSANIGAPYQGMWLWIVKKSDGSITTLDLNEVSNTPDAFFVAWELTKKGDYLYLTCEDGATNELNTDHTLFIIIDVSDPTSPTITKRFTEETSGQTAIQNCLIKGNYMYFVMRRNYNGTRFTQWRVYDITTPSSPSALATQTYPWPAAHTAGEAVSIVCGSADMQNTEGYNIGKITLA